MRAFLDSGRVQDRLISQRLHMENFLSSPLFLRWAVLRQPDDTLVAVVGLVVPSTSHTGQDWLKFRCWCRAILVLRLPLSDADSQSYDRNKLDVTKSSFGARALESLILKTHKLVYN
jgi:hypothetical protein